VLATFIVILNETIMINAIPRLKSDLGITADAAQWLSTAVMLTMAAVIPVTGWILQRVPTRTAYVTAMTVFCTGTALAAIAPSFELLLGARIIQAGGTAVMMPLLMTTLMTVTNSPRPGSRSLTWRTSQTRRAWGASRFLAASSAPFRVGRVPDGPPCRGQLELPRSNVLVVARAAYDSSSSSSVKFMMPMLPVTSASRDVRSYFE
jgi:MFS family permease